MDTPYNLLSMENTATQPNRKPRSCLSERCKTSILVFWAVTMTIVLTVNIALTVQLLHLRQTMQEKSERSAGDAMLEVLRLTFNLQNISGAHDAAAPSLSSASSSDSILSYIPQEQLSHIQGSCRGQKGDQGTALPGEKGNTGETGLKGAEGLHGLDGLPGLSGLPGQKGEPGITGQPGDNGMRGPVGVNGETGSIGLPGPAGLPGLPGDKGDSGQIGATGYPGAQGDPGLKGEVGSKGAKGDVGLKGDKGEHSLQETTLIEENTTAPMTTSVMSGPAPLGRGSVRLGGLRRPSASGSTIQGTLELYDGSRWGYVCDDPGIDEETVTQVTLGRIAQVVCRNLGASPSSVSHNALLPEDHGVFGDHNFVLDNVSCTGSETTLLDCNHGTLWAHNCGNYEGINVTCTI